MARVASGCSRATRDENFLPGAIGAIMIAPGLAARFRRMRSGLLFALLVLAFVVIVLWRSIVITVPAGHGGVMWWRFFGGTALTAEPFQEGQHLIFPWDKIYIYDMRLQKHRENYDVVSAEGLLFQVHITFRWRPDRSNLGVLHASIGPHYLETLLVPEIGSIARARIAMATAEELISKGRAAIQQEIYQSIVTHEKSNGIGSSQLRQPSDLIDLKDVLIQDVILPERIRAAIERKLEQQEAIVEARFRVESEKFESARKEVEAEGVRKFQEIVTPAISEAYLRWRGIDATLKLANSPNSKIVIMGNGPGGLPVILNGLDSERPAPAQPRSADGVPAAPLRPSETRANP